MEEVRKATREVLDFATSEMRVRAEGLKILQILWPLVDEGTKFVIVTDRSKELLAVGEAVAVTPSGQHVRVDFEDHALEKGRWYRIRLQRPEDLTLPRVSHGE